MTGFILIFALLFLLCMIAMPFIPVIVIILQRRHNRKRAQGGVFVSHRSEYANMEPSPADVAPVAARYGIMPDARGWMGWRCVTHDAGGMGDNIRGVAATVDLNGLAAYGLVRGVPGSGLEDSSFTADQIGAGIWGESLLARAIMAGRPRVLSWWSLYGFDECLRLSDSDIDCVLVGIRPDGRPVAWFVDAKRYKGGSDTSYVNVDAWHLARVSRARRAFVLDSEGRAWTSMSPNMWEQRERWQGLLARYGVVSYWVVCVTPPGGHGTPDMTTAVWPGGVTCMDIPSLRAMVDSVCVPDMFAAIPPGLVSLLDSHIKY